MQMIFWCTCFVLRVYYSFRRYNRFFGISVFRENANGGINWDLKTFVFTQSISEQHVRLKNDIECSICKIEYEEGSECIEFPCKGKHVFHAEC